MDPVPTQSPLDQFYGCESHIRKAKFPVEDELAKLRALEPQLPIRCNERNLVKPLLDIASVKLAICVATVEMIEALKRVDLATFEQKFQPFSDALHILEPIKNGKYRGDVLDLVRRISEVSRLLKETNELIKFKTCFESVPFFLFPGLLNTHLLAIAVETERVEDELDPEATLLLRYNIDLHTAIGDTIFSRIRTAANAVIASMQGNTPPDFQTFSANIYRYAVELLQASPDCLESQIFLHLLEQQWLGVVALTSEQEEEDAPMEEAQD